MKAVVLSGMLFLPVAALQAQQTDGSWSENESGLWSDSTKWLDGQIADGVGAIANLAYRNINATRVVSMDSSRTLGVLYIGDQGGSAHSMNIASLNDSILTFDNFGADSLLRHARPDGGGTEAQRSSTVGVEIVLMNGLRLDNTSTNTGSGALSLTGAIHAGSAGTKTISNISTGSLSTLIGGAISDGSAGGSIALVQNSVGKLVLTGENTYSGGTTISTGTLQVGGNAFDNAAGTSGNLTGMVENHGDLVFNRSNGVTFDGTISGTGRLTQKGGGVLTLTEASTHEGGTVIEQGVLEVVNTTGSSTGSGDVVLSSANAMLTGNGIIAPGAGNRILVEAGILNPGLEGTGALNIDFTGDSKLVFEAGTTLQITLSDAGATSINFLTIGDWLSGSGNVSLDFIILGAGFPMGEYTLINNVTTAGFEFSQVRGLDGLDYRIAFTGDSYVLRVIPEPREVALAMAATCLTLLGVRRRRVAGSKR